MVSSGGSAFAVVRVCANAFVHAVTRRPGVKSVSVAAVDGPDAAARRTTAAAGSESVTLRAGLITQPFESLPTHFSARVRFCRWRR